MTVEFVEEAPRPTGYRQQQVAELQANPGQWALVDTTKHKVQAWQLAAYFRTSFPGVEASARGCQVFARWAPEEA